jgi:hypothetical protein
VHFLRLADQVMISYGQAAVARQVMIYFLPILFLAIIFSFDACCF